MASTGFNLSATPATTQASLTTTTLTTQSQQPSTHSMNFFSLEENINKWKLELEEQEKLFLNQAAVVNGWDSVLLKNGDKIVELNKAVEKVKADQLTIEQELEFISAQHSELEEMIAPLEKDLAKITQPIDVERSQTYLMAETLDSQLKQMSEELKEVIEHLNEANKYSDSSDPMVTMVKILNAHFSSLQWIEDKSQFVSNRVEVLNKLSSSFRENKTSQFRYD